MMRMIDPPTIHIRLTRASREDQKKTNTSAAYPMAEERHQRFTSMSNRSSQSASLNRSHASISSSAVHDSKYDPAYEGAYFDKSGYCLKHPMIRLHMPVDRRRGNKTQDPGDAKNGYTNIIEICPMCSSSVRNEHKSKEPTSGEGNVVNNNPPSSPASLATKSNSSKGQTWRSKESLLEKGDGKNNSDRDSNNSSSGGYRHEYNRRVKPTASNEDSNSAVAIPDCPQTKGIVNKSVQGQQQIQELSGGKHHLPLKKAPTRGRSRGRSRSRNDNNDQDDRDSSSKTPKTVCKAEQKHSNGSDRGHSNSNRRAKSPNSKRLSSMRESNEKVTVELVADFQRRMASRSKSIEAPRGNSVYSQRGSSITRSFRSKLEFSIHSSCRSVNDDVDNSTIGTKSTVGRSRSFQIPTTNLRSRSKSTSRCSKSTRDVKSGSHDKNDNSKMSPHQEVKQGRPFRRFNSNDDHPHQESPCHSNRMSSLYRRKSMEDFGSVMSSISSYSLKDCQQHATNAINTNTNNPCRMEPVGQSYSTKSQKRSLSRNAKRLLKKMDGNKHEEQSSLSLRFDVPFNPYTGNCNYHSNVCLAVKDTNGGWKTVRNVCPKCRRMDGILLKSFGGV